MQQETRQCQNCKNQFTIEVDDFAFYEKMKVPPPTFCPRCRLARRLVWRNERSLYKRTCDLCKKNVISMYRADAVFPVYCHDCFLGDGWNPLIYGREYDFGKSFFEQFKLLQNVVPRSAVYATQNVRSDYCNYTAHMKDGYLMFGSWFSENCGYGQTVLECKDCWDCLFIKNCEQCFASVDCTRCNLTHFSEKCFDCFNSAFLFDCRNCQNCLFSTNLRNKSYHIFNKQVSKEEFEKTKRETFSSYAALKKAMGEFRRLVREKALHKFMTGERNSNVSGEFIYQSKNVFDSYYINDGERERYAVRGGKGQKDAMDVFGVHAGELAYECNNIDFSSRCLFSVNGENNLNSHYLVDSDHMNNSFGCIAIRKKEFCILNKQYDEKTFHELLEKIVNQMSEMPYVDAKGRTYKYGELFPIELSPHSYNETLAQEYVPVTKVQAAERGYSWYESEEKSYAATKSWKELPDVVAEVKDDILSEIILCEAWDTDRTAAQEHKCSKAFKITLNELVIYRRWNLPLPRKCPNTRNFELSLLRNPVNFYDRTCACAGVRSQGTAYQNTAEHFHGANPCSNQFKTSYAPDKPEIVYCESCYNSEVV